MSALNTIGNQIVPIAITIPLNSNHSINNNLYSNGIQHQGNTGADLFTHLEFNIKAGLNLDWCATTILRFSKSAPYLVKSHTWVLDYLLTDLHTNLSKTSALSLRNFSQDTEFIQALALNPRTRKVLLDVLTHFVDYESGDNEDEEDSILKNIDNELLFYTVDIVECISSYYAPCPKDDELFLNLTKIFLGNHDRSLLISLMRSFSRFLVRSELTVDSCASNLNSPIFDKIVSFLLTEDHDLLLASLDFLYQYSLPGNARILNIIKSYSRQEILKVRLPQLLTFQLNITNNPNDLINKKPLRLIKRTKPPIPEVAPKLSPEHFKSVSQLAEPLRATAWMRCCYKTVPEGEVTQISLWKAYEQQFENEAHTHKKKLLPAVDFIKNVSQAFANSNAMVINLSNGQRKFIIKGIQPREYSVDIKTGDYEVKMPPSNDYNSDLINQKPAQEKLIPYNPPKELNEVNKSTALLINSLINHPTGQELIFKPIEETIFKKIEAAPLLYDELVDSLKYLH